LIIVFLGILLFLELYTFLPALLGAITLYIVMRRWMFYLVEKKRWRKGWTAALLMFLSLIVILLPIAVLINMLSSKITIAVQHSNELMDAM
jgi:predicted PurR-regulated permease PerM